MKKFLLILVAIITLGFIAKADNDRVITFDQLPQPAQSFIKQHFANKVPWAITVDFDDYKIMFETGEKVEFDKQGNWKEVNCKSSNVPSAIIPDQIKKNVKSSFPGTIILKLDRKYNGYEVKLSNGLEIEYDSAFRVIDIDD